MPLSAAGCTNNLGSKCCSSTEALSDEAEVWMFPLAGFFVPYIVGMIVLKHLLQVQNKEKSP